MMEELREHAVRLVCLCSAGAAPYAYSAWRGLAPSWVEVVPVCYPGRGARRREPLLHSVPELAADVVRNLAADADHRPVALFGHSLGALVGYEAARALSVDGRLAPCGMVAAAAGGPFVPPREISRHLSDGAFLERLQRIGGTPREILDDRGLVSFLLPALRADFEAYEVYDPDPRPRPDFPILVLGGHGDREVPPADLHAWSSSTNGAVEVRMVDGGHFFPQETPAGVLDIVVERIAAGLVGRQPAAGGVGCG